MKLWAAAALLLAPSIAVAGEPAYRLVPALDIPVAAASLAISAATLLSTPISPAWCAPRCDPSTLPGIDSGLAGRWDTGFRTVSDVGLGVAVAGSVLLLGLVEDLGDAAQDGAVVLESVLVASALQTLTAMAVRRPRPFLYGDTAPLSDRTSPSAGLSFFSGHASASFAAVTAFWRALRRIDGGDTTRSWIAFGVGLGLASLVAASRVGAGQHFPTDVLAGAVVGSSIGVLVPALHEWP
jgi:membrane-associated phospholipid phosphatase